MTYVVAQGQPPPTSWDHPEGHPLAPDTGIWLVLGGGTLSFEISSEVPSKDPSKDSGDIPQ